MHTDSGRFTLAAKAVRTCSNVKQRIACSEVDAIARRRARRTSETATYSTHVSLSEAMARQRQREVLGL